MAAGPAVESVWQEFKDGPFQVLALEMWRNSAFYAQTYKENAGVTFPVLWGGAFLQSASYYGISYDNYIVIDPDGIVRYTSIGESVKRFNPRAVRDVIRQYTPTPVEAPTWGAVKGLYRD